MLKSYFYLILGSILMSFSTIAQDSLFTKNRLIDFGKIDIDTIRKIDVVILHSSYCIDIDSFSLECILKYYKKYDVSAHYIIDRQGTIHRLVDENNIAHHAGKGILPDSINKPNTRSIGIELINTKATSYTEEQYKSLSILLKNIKKRHQIKYILGHSDIAPNRKTDPWNFDWKYFLSIID